MKTGVFLFSVDLEEFVAASRVEFRRTPLAELTRRYLLFLAKHGMKATFFVVGEIARKFPSLIQEIAAAGHELACHTDSHIPLNQHTPSSLREDLRRNIDALQNCTGNPVLGFRAPVLSMTEQTRWAYPILAEAGIRYSSSVLPARNPLHGWPGFGAKARSMDGVLEVPVTLARFGALELPFAAGTYFRLLPLAWIKRRFADCSNRGEPVVGYFHPYDLDTTQEWVMNAGVNGNPLLNALLYINRGRTLKGLDFILGERFTICRYDEYLK